MNIAMPLLSEMLKTRRTASFYLTMAISALIPSIFLLDVIFGTISPQNRVDPLNNIVREGFGVMSLLILPGFIILICTLLPQLEYRNNTWKQVFASPQSMSEIFIAKFLNVQLLVGFFFLFFNAWMLLLIAATHFIVPSLDIINQPFNGYRWWTFNVNAYVSVIAICGIQFWLGLKCKNFIVPMAIAFVMMIVGIIITLNMKLPGSYIFPYSYTVINTFPEFKAMMPKMQWWTAGYGVLFLIMGFLDFRRRRGK